MSIMPKGAGMSTEFGGNPPRDIRRSITAYVVAMIIVCGGAKNVSPCAKVIEGKRGRVEVPEEPAPGSQLLGCVPTKRCRCFLQWGGFLKPASQFPILCQVCEFTLFSPYVMIQNNLGDQRFPLKYSGSWIRLSDKKQNMKDICSQFPKRDNFSVTLSMHVDNFNKISLKSLFSQRPSCFGKGKIL